MSNIEFIFQEIKPEINFLEQHDFIETGLLDSFDIILLVAAMEERMGVNIDGADIVPENFCNMEAIKRMLEKYCDNP